jgi:hypothetical protein
MRDRERNTGNNRSIKNRTMKSLTRTASIIHKIIRDHEIKKDVIGKAHRKNE